MEPKVFFAKVDEVGNKRRFSRRDVTPGQDLGMEAKTISRRKLCLWLSTTT
jgi:hypothetical protein